MAHNDEGVIRLPYPPYPSRNGVGMYLFESTATLDGVALPPVVRCSRPD